MAVVRGIILPARIANRVQLIVEPELDMNRLQRRLSAVGVFRELMRKLLPSGQDAARTPMRSVARELEEVWPSRDT